MNKISIVTLSFSALCVLSFDWLPLALLTPIRLDLGLSVSQMGVALGWFGFLTFAGSIGSFFLSRFVSVIHLLRVLLVALSFLSFLLATYPTSIVFILARLVGGAIFGSFWTITTAASFSLNDEYKKDTLSSLYMGNAITLAVILPLGVLANGLIKWQWLFIILGTISLITALFSSVKIFKDTQSFVIPFSQGKELFRTVSDGIKMNKTDILVSFLTISCMFAGCACIYPYFRVLFETNTHLLNNQFSYIFALEGFAGILGVQILKVLQKKLPRALGKSIMFLIFTLSVLGACLFLFVHSSFDHNLPTLCLLIAGWGFGLNAMAFLWPLWLAQFKNVDPFALIAVKIGLVQLSVMAGTWVGAFTISKHWGDNFIVGSAILMVAFILSLITIKYRHRTEIFNLENS